MEKSSPGALLAGGDSSRVEQDLQSGVQNIFSTRRAFAALKSDGSVITWGNPSYGGASSAVYQHLQFGVKNIFSTNKAFAALKLDGRVITWGRRSHGGFSFHFSQFLKMGVVEIQVIDSNTFRAIKNDSTYVEWGKNAKNYLHTKHKCNKFYCKIV